MTYYYIFIIIALLIAGTYLFSTEDSPVCILPFFVAACMFIIGGITTFESSGFVEQKVYRLEKTPYRVIIQVKGGQEYTWQDAYTVSFINNDKLDKVLLKQDYNAYGQSNGAELKLTFKD